MARKSPTAWVESQPGSECFVFDEHVVGQIPADAKVRLAPNGMTLAAASDELNRAAYWLRMFQNVSELPSSTELGKALKQILTHATALQALLRVVDDDGLDGAGANPRVVDGIGYLLLDEMRRAMDERYRALAERSGEARSYEEVFGAHGPKSALAVLAELVGVVAVAARRNMRDDPPSRAVKEASPLTRFVRAASAVYMQLTNQIEPRRSRGSNGKAGGPLLRFLQACCKQVGEDVPMETLATWVRDWRKQQKVEGSSVG